MLIESFVLRCLLGVEEWNCIAHTLNLAVHDALQLARSSAVLIEKVQLFVYTKELLIRITHLQVEQLVAEVRSRTLVLDQLRELLEEADLRQKTLLKSGETRWDSTVRMLRSVYNARFAIAELEAQNQITSELQVQSRDVSDSLSELIVTKI